MNILLFILATIGLSQIIVDGDIFGEPKKLFKKTCQYLKSIERFFKILSTITILWICIRLPTICHTPNIIHYFMLMLLFMIWLKFDKAVDCYLCTGTWAGFLMGSIFINNDLFYIFGCGCAGAFLSNITAILIAWVESITLKNIKEN